MTDVLVNRKRRIRPPTFNHVAHFDIGIRYNNWSKMMRRHIARGYLTEEEITLAVDIHNKLEQLSEKMREQCRS